MGRKIPGKKHHGVKDPEKQAQKRLEKVKAKINSAPKSGSDDQEVPKKLRLMMKAKEEVKQGKFERIEREKKDRDRAKRDQTLLDSAKHMGSEMRLKGMTRPLKPVPVFKQRPGEAPKKFLNRMERQVQNVLKQKEYEDKYDVDIVRDEETGKTRVVDRQEDELEFEAKKKRLAKRGIHIRSKEEKRQIKRLKEKEKGRTEAKWKKKRRLGKLLNADGDVIAEEDEDKDFDDERFRDRVGFGEVAQAPPELKKLKKLQHWESRRPAEKGGLLLEGKLQQQGKNKKAKAKKAAVSLAKQDMLDKERERVIEEYRSIKMNKLNKVKM